jgi:tripartite-type tricarboxylate transporter receptor subunit TctC
VIAMKECYPILKFLATLGTTALVALQIGGCGSESTTSELNAPLSSGYYERETVTLIMGLDASAGGTTVGRLLAKHLETALDGHPNVIVKNMPGASMINAHLFVLLKAPKDGTTVYYGPRSSLGELLEFPGHSFKYSQFTVLGGVQLAPLVTYVRKDMLEGGIQSPSDILKADGLVFGGISAEHGRMIVSTMGLDLIGARYHFVGGYPGSGKIRAAVLSGEVNMATDAAHAYINEVVPTLEQEDLNAPLFSLPVLTAQGGLARSPLVPNIPTVNELYEEIYGEPPSGINWDSILTMIQIDQTMQHVFLGPPGMNEEAVEAFRAAIAPAMTTLSFAEEATRILSYVPDAVDAMRATEILNATAQVNSETQDFIKAQIMRNSSY